jgi:hypothetical protein
MDALAILRDDAQKLTPQAARAAQCYVLSPLLAFPDVWRSALLRSLEDVAGDTSPLDHDSAASVLGVPGAWLPAACVGTWLDLRLWLGAVMALAAQHAPSPPAQS